MRGYSLAVQVTQSSVHRWDKRDAYYCRKVLDAHPVEFAELRAEWSERLN